MSQVPPREIAVQIVRDLRGAGHVAYLAGGCVRDELLNLTPKDYDVATDAPPERVAAIFRRTRAVGKSFGVTLVSLGDVTVEVSTFRREGAYSDRRRPDEVTFSDAESDAHRRDFTINALFIDPLDLSQSELGAVIDYVGGLTDLDAGIVRAVGNPDRRLAEDHLRALRAVRFAARLGFAIEAQTAEAVMRHARELQGVSRERIGDELRLMARDPCRGQAFSLIERLGLDGPALLEPPRGPGGALEVIHSLPDWGVRFGMALAAWATDRLSGAEGPASPPAIAEAAANWPGRWRRALCLSNDETVEMRATLQGVAMLESRWADMGVAARKRAAGSFWFPGALSVVAGRNETWAEAIEAEVRSLAAEPGGLTPPPLVTGDDLIRAGLAAGPQFQKWLERAYDAQLEGGVTSREAALELVLNWVRSGS